MSFNYDDLLLILGGYAVWQVFLLEGGANFIKTDKALRIKAATQSAVLL